MLNSGVLDVNTSLILRLDLYCYCVRIGEIGRENA